MKTWRKLVKISLEVIAVLLLVFVLITAIRLVIPENITETSLAGITPSPTEIAYPPPWGPTTDPTIVALMLEAEATQRYEPPTPTEPPLPTLMPTPVVTPIPLAEFPVLPGKTEGTFTIVYRQENTLRAVDSDGQNDRLLLDVGARLSLYLVNEKFGPGNWGSASPDGKQLALVLANMAEPPQERGGAPLLFDIYLYDLQSGDLRMLVSNADEPVWSPDGTKIAYRSTETFGLWVLDIRNGSTQEVFSINRPVEDYAINFIVWAPDGLKLAFVRSFSSTGVGEIWIIDTGGWNRILVPMEMLAGSLNWSPDGKTILFTSDYRGYVTPTHPVNLWTVEIETGITKQLTKNIFVAGGIPNWSPDGNWIAFTGIPLFESDSSSYELWMISRDGDELVRCTKDMDHELYPNWISDITIEFQKPGSGLWNINLQNGILTQILRNDTEYFIEIITLKNN